LYIYIPDDKIKKYLKNLWNKTKEVLSVIGPIAAIIIALKALGLF